MPSITQAKHGASTSRIGFANCVAGVDVARIRELNDAFRKYPWADARALGKTVMTVGISAHGPEFVLKVLNAVAGFDGFTTNNDPHQEHDFGNLEVDGQKIYFKIDLYEKTDVKHLLGRP